MLWGLWPVVLVAGGAAAWLAVAPTGERDLDTLVDQLTDLRQAPGASFLIVGVLVGLFLISVPILPTASALGLAFGASMGVTYTIIAGFTSALILFGFGRILGRPAVQRFAGPKIKGLDERLSRHGILTIVLLRFTPLMPFFVINLLAGSSRISWRDFAAGTVLGLTPTIVGFALVGGSVQEILTAPSFRTAVTLGALLVVLVALVWVMGRWARRRKLDRLQAEEEAATDADATTDTPAMRES